MAGLLDFNDPQTVGLLSAAAGLLAASGPQRTPVSLGQAIGQGATQGLQAYQGTKAFNQQQALGAEQLKQLQIANALSGAKSAFFLGGAAPASGAPSPASTVITNPGANSAYGVPFSGSAAQPSPQGAGPSLPNVPGLSPEMSRAAALGWLSPGYVSAIAAANKPFSGRAGAPVWGVGPDGKLQIVGFSPKLDEGMTFGPNGQVQLAPGYAEAKAQTGAIPNASAPMIDVPVYLGGGDQRNIKLTQPEYLEFQKSGQLPSRYGQLSGAQPSPQTPSAPLRTGQGGVPNLAQQAGRTAPVVGATQTQNEQVQQAADQARKVAEAKSLTEAQFDAPAARAAVADALQNLGRMKKEADAVLNDPALSRITGGMSVLPNMPGSAASDVQARLNALKSQVGFSVLQAMRAASKTGGALGAISDKENELLQRNLAALDNAQSTEGMKRALKQVQEYADAAAQRIQNAYRDQYERVQGSQGMVPTQKGAVPTNSVNPQAIVDELRRRGVIK